MNHDMMRFLPYVCIPAYLAIGFAVGIILRYRLARHLRVQHNLTQRPKYGDDPNNGCWCREIRIEGDVMFALPYVSFLIWPIIAAATIISIPFKVYGKILRLMDRLALHDRTKSVAGGGCEQELWLTYDELKRVYNSMAVMYQRALETCDRQKGEIASLEEEIISLRKLHEDVSRENLDYESSLKSMAQDNKRLEEALFKTTDPKTPPGAAVIKAGSGGRSLLDPNVTIEEEFKKRTGRVLGGDVG